MPSCLLAPFPPLHGSSPRLRRTPSLGTNQSTNQLRPIVSTKYESALLFSQLLWRVRVSLSALCVEPILNVVDLHVEIAGKEVLKGVNLCIYPGETHILFGPNGSGKSTLIKTIIGLRLAPSILFVTSIVSAR